MVDPIYDKWLRSEAGQNAVRSCMACLSIRYRDLKIRAMPRAQREALRAWFASRMYELGRYDLDIDDPGKPKPWHSLYNPTDAF